MLNDHPEKGAQEEQQADLGRDQARERSRARFAAAWVEAARQKELAQKREQMKERKQAEEVAAWKSSVRTEQRQLPLRKDGQLARLLGEPLPGELPALLQRLASEDLRVRPDAGWWRL